MKKADKLRLDASLDRALAPPRRQPQKALDDLLGEYDDRRQLTPSSPPTPSRPSSTPRPPTPSSVPLAPVKDFQKVPNSLAREAVPQGLFVGKSKQLYDYLYSLTRGAIKPSKSARVSKEKLLSGADIGSDVTLKKNLLHLRAVGLVTWRELGGTHGGNEYTVFLLEELQEKPTSTTPSRGGSPSSPSNPRQFLEGLEGLETRGSRGGLNSVESTSSESPKTLYKTNTDDDDEPYRDLLETLKKATTELTGAPPQAGERTRWAEVARVLESELKEAAAKTTVTSVPAFLAAHLKRKLARKIKTEGPVHDPAPDKSDVARGVVPAATGRRLEPDEVREQARIIAELLEGGYTLERAEAQFAASFDATDWEAIKLELSRAGD